LGGIDPGVETIVVVKRIRIGEHFMPERYEALEARSGVTGPFDSVGSARLGGELRVQQPCHLASINRRHFCDRRFD
jgi:hypothetical protein